MLDRGYPGSPGHPRPEIRLGMAGDRFPEAPGLVDERVELLGAEGRLLGRDYGLASAPVIPTLMLSTPCFTWFAPPSEPRPTPFTAPPAQLVAHPCGVASAWPPSLQMIGPLATPGARATPG